MLKKLLIASCLFTSASAIADVDNQFTFKIKNELNIPISINYNYGCPMAVDSTCFPYRPPSQVSGGEKTPPLGQGELGQAVLQPNQTITVTNTMHGEIYKPADHSYAQDLQIFENPNFSGGRLFDPLCFARYGQTMDIYGEYKKIDGKKHLVYIHCKEETT